MTKSMINISFDLQPMQPWQLQKKLALFSEKEVDLVINENHSTFLSFERVRGKIKFSLHKLFLHANDHVCEAIIDYSVKRKRDALKKIRYFANNYFYKADYSSAIDEEKLKTNGKFYDLKEIYNSLNELYFKGKLNLKITWFKKPRYRTFSSLTFGSYNRPLRLIRINEILDNGAIPSYFVEYVIFHEMLHHICPSFTDENGREHFHTPAFKKKEKEYIHYAKAKAWEKKQSFFWNL